MRSTRRASIALCLSIVAVAGAPAAAAPVKIFRAQSAQQLLTGTFDGVSLDPLGALRLADRADRLAALEEPFLLAAAPHPQGWVLGTGNAGRVLLVDRSGKSSVLFQAPEPEVFAVWSDADGTVYAGTSPQGKVYRIAKGKGEVWFEPGETYVWAIQRAADGALLVATGTQGRLYRVTGRGAGTIFYDSDDTHIRALQALASGDVLLGTAGEGLVLRLDAQGRARTLYDADKPEIVGFAVAPDGTAYTAALQSEAGMVGQAESQAREGKGDKGQSADAKAGEKDEAQAVVTVIAEGEGAAAAAPRGQKSEVLRIAASGAVESVWSFDGETVYALAWARGRLWVGTGLEGKLYSLQDEPHDPGEGRRRAPDRGPGGGRSGPGVRHHQRGGALSPGRRTASARAPTPACRSTPARSRASASSAGRARRRDPPGSRSGPASPPSPIAPGRRGASRAKGASWRCATCRPGATYSGGPSSRASARRRRASPRPSCRIARKTSRRASPASPRWSPGRSWCRRTSIPANQVYEPAHPARDGIFTTLSPPPRATTCAGSRSGRRAIARCAGRPPIPTATSCVSRSSSAPRRGGSWLAMTQDLDEDHYGFDETALPDGTYRFRLRASDAEANADGGSLEGEETSEPVVIDSTPPKLLGIRRAGAKLRVDLDDALSPMREAVVSVDGAEWQPALAEDGLLDGRRETLLVERPPGARLLLVRVTDAANNVVAFDLLGEEP